MKPKFKVGDKVRILDGSKIDNYAGGWVEDMADDVGKIVTISEAGNYLGSERVFYHMKEICWTWDERGLESVEKFKVGDKVIGNAKANVKYNITDEGFIGTITRNLDDGRIEIDNTFSVDSECFDLYTECDQKIVIERHGNKVVAKCGKKVGVAKCSPTDKFDFETGAKIAFDRLFEKPLLNTKFCVIKGDDTFKTGHVYNVVNGKIKANGHCDLPTCSELHSIEELYDYFKSIHERKLKFLGWSSCGLKIIEVIDD